MSRTAFSVLSWVLSLFATIAGFAGDADASRPLVIITSPSVKDAVQALGAAFESAHPDVRVQVAVDMALDVRRTIAGMENRGKYFIESGPIHLIAPGGDELIRRLEQRYYVLSETKALYAT